MKGTAKEASERAAAFLERCRDGDRERNLAQLCESAAPGLTCWVDAYMIPDHIDELEDNAADREDRLDLFQAETDGQRTLERNVRLFGDLYGAWVYQPPIFDPAEVVRTSALREWLDGRAMDTETVRRALGFDL